MRQMLRFHFVVVKHTSAAIIDGRPLLQMYSAYIYHSGNVSSSSVNGDIALLWEWSNFDYPNPLTDKDKTLHN